MRDSITLLEDDTRAVASLLGFVLLFGIAVIGFSMYQAYAVPDQNAQTEFQHFEEAKDQMVAFRSAAIDTASDDIPRSVTFDLGTRFQQRYLAVNPPPPTGTLATSEQYNITINPGAANEEKISARFLEFDPNYREFHPGVLRYEHGIVYLDAREVNGDVVVLAGEMNMTNGENMYLAPLQNDFSQTGQQRISIELYAPNLTNIENIDKSDIRSVQVPTRLNESQWKANVGLTGANITDYTTNEGEPNTITIDGGTIADVAPVGIQEQPESANSTINEPVEDGSLEITRFEKLNGDNAEIEISGRGQIEELTLETYTKKNGQEASLDITIEGQEYELSSGEFVPSEALPVSVDGSRVFSVKLAQGADGQTVTWSLNGGPEKEYTV